MKLVLQSEKEKWIKIEALENKDKIEVYITDSGSGISDENIEKIMSPFFTTKAVGKGTGLGLSISQRIIETHHGKIFYDTNSKNTRFVIQLPKK